MQAGAAHAGIPEVKKLAGRRIGNRCRLDRIVDLDGVSLGHAVVPKEIEIGWTGHGAPITTKLLL